MQRNEDVFYASVQYGHLCHFVSSSNASSACFENFIQFLWFLNSSEIFPPKSLFFVFPKGLGVHYLSNKYYVSVLLCATQHQIPAEPSFTSSVVSVYEYFVTNQVVICMLLDQTKRIFKQIFNLFGQAKDKF